MGFRYIPENSSYYNEEHATIQKDSTRGPNGGPPILYLKKGVTMVRIMPPHEASGGRWSTKILEHSVKVGDKWASATCPDENWLCPICELGQEIFLAGKAQGNVEEMDRGRDYSRRAQYLSNVICWSCPDAEMGGPGKGIMVMKYGTKVYEQLVALNQNMVGGWADITNLANGVDLSISRSGTGKTNTRYMVTPVSPRSPLQGKLSQQSIDLGSLTLWDLSQVLLPKSTDELAALLAGQSKVRGFQAKPQEVQSAPVQQPFQVGTSGTQPMQAPGGLVYPGRANAAGQVAPPAFPSGVVPQSQTYPAGPNVVEPSQTAPGQSFTIAPTPVAAPPQQPVSVPQGQAQAVNVVAPFRTQNGNR